jgi:hypothetical protein
VVDDSPPSSSLALFSSSDSPPEASSSSEYSTLRRKPSFTAQSVNADRALDRTSIESTSKYGRSARIEQAPPHVNILEGSDVDDDGCGCGRRSRRSSPPPPPPPPPRSSMSPSTTEAAPGCQ